MGCLKSTSKSPGLAPGFSFQDYSNDFMDQNLKVNKAAFDAVLGKLLSSPPMPKATISPKRARRRKAADRKK
jgi:hypothetical protein